MTGQAADIRSGDRPRLSSSDQIVRDVVRGLYEGRFVAGQRLVEPDLMRLYGVSRGTVREALKRLAAEGVVSITAFRGAQIRHLSRAEARDLLQLLEVTIGLAARLAAQNIASPRTREAFIAACENLSSFAGRGDSFDFVQARNRFYRAMTRAGGNAEVARAVRGFRVHLIRTYLRPPVEERFADYREMAEAILNGDAEAAEAAGRRHIRRSLDALDDAPDSVFAPAGPAQPGILDDEEFDRG
ncbi:GntR family transcriptional regulator [Mesorhizobium sp. J428]|uniref:GntR family transcriptional regulator n=1 Tax=Mesorhizobium sp. J428 TaxID=2898440 RepID=UPI0021513541|nr:GntR family transcriptional regulator [Mesorhizobium sp. J428]MCR5858116.1 GntR family transcriptional regulator [Mesorhizobium sp. J428]